MREEITQIGVKSDARRDFTFFRIISVDQEERKEGMTKSGINRWEKMDGRTNLLTVMMFRYTQTQISNKQKFLPQF